MDNYTGMPIVCAMKSLMKVCQSNGLTIAVYTMHAKTSAVCLLSELGHHIQGC